MIQKTVGDIDREINALSEQIAQLQKDRFVLINIAQPLENAWRDACNTVPRPAIIYVSDPEK